MEYLRLVEQCRSEWPSVEYLEQARLTKAAGEEGDEFDAFRMIFDF